MLINTTSLNALRTGYQAIYNAAFHKVEPLWEKVAMKVDSSDEKETYGWLGSNTAFREWVGERVLQNLITHDFAIKNKDFENTVTVPRNKIEDDKQGIYKPMMEMLGYNAASHPDKLVFDLLKNGTTTLCYDGQYFFDTDHPVVQSDGSIASVSNYSAGDKPAWYLLDTTKPIKPLIYQKRSEYEFVALDDPKDEENFKRKQFVYGVDGRGNSGFALWQLAYASTEELTPENYAKAFTALESIKGDNGESLNITPNLLVVSTANRFRANGIVVADKNAAGATNIYQGTADVLVVPYL